VTGFDDGKARAVTLSLLDQRAADATVCPSEVARALAGEGAGEGWREAMPVVHTAVDCLLRDGVVRLSWKGAALETRSGPYRIAYRRGAQKEG
jgi:hypothetical protein